MTGKQLRQAFSALLQEVPEKFASDALGIDRGTVRYLRGHRPDVEVASQLIVARLQQETAPAVKAV